MAEQPVEYDLFADIYEVWTGSAGATMRNLPFYVEEYVDTPGVVVELGVGNGRIAVEAAHRGKAIFGVDYSREMLKLCRQKAEAAGVAHLLTLIQGDFRDFVLPELAQLITIPFHTIGHLVTLEDKLEGLKHIYTQLAPGGRLIFDHFIFDPEAARQHYATVHLRDEFTDPDTGHDMLLWVAVRHNTEAQTMRIIAWTDEVDESGIVLERRYRRLGFSWLHPEQARELLEEAGFLIEVVYGDFDRSPLEEGSPEQIWVARKAS